MRICSSTLQLLCAAALLAGCQGNDGSDAGQAGHNGKSGDSARKNDKAPLSAPSGDAVRGKQLLAQYHCGSCHAIPEVPVARGVVGPTLDGYGRRSYIAGHIPNAPETLARFIVDPAALKPGTSMPAMGVSLAEARDMAAYLTALQ
ncbi:MAG: c-type cytochrome [Duganella sp.]